MKTSPSDTDRKYRGVEPSQEYLDQPVRLNSAPADFTPNDGESATTSSSEGEAQAANEGLVRYFYTSGPNGYKFQKFVQRGVGGHVEVWVAADLSWPADDPREKPVVTDAQVQHLISEFDNNIYPTESKLFGEPAPRNGMNSTVSQLFDLPADYYHTSEDAGNKTVLLVMNIRDKNYYNASYPLYIVGYYSPSVQSLSNRNVITIDAAYWDSISGSDDTIGIEGTLAHEYQHLIHGDLDGDETSWINEGMSDYAEYATGYGIPESHINGYEQLPSNSLTNWGDQGAINILSDYGQAFVFQLYLNDRYGPEFISDLAHNDKNGIESVEAELDEYGAKTDFYGLYQDFATAVVLDDVSSPPKDVYHIDGIELHVNTSSPVDTAGAWGTTYKVIDTSNKGPITDVTVSGIQFIGTQWQTTTDPVDGEGQVLYSGQGNLLDRFAIVRADLSDTENPTLTFETNYDIEQNWDYGFVQISTDGGETWHSLSNEHTSTETADGAHPTVKENVPGFTGTSDGWTTQTFDLSEYADEGEVLIAFRYTTDWAAVHQGWYVRDISVAGQTYSGDSIEPFMSLREATGEYIEYQFTFIGIKENGNYKVKQLDMRTFSDADQQELKKFLHNGNFEKIIVASAWAANPGEGGRVPVGVDITFQNEEEKKDKKQKKRV